MSQNYQLYGHLHREKLMQLSDYVKRLGFAPRKHRRINGEFDEVQFTLTDNF